MELSRKVHEASLGCHGNIALKQNEGQDKYSYFYNIFGSGASYYRLSYTHLLYMICNSDKYDLLMILLKLQKLKWLFRQKQHIRLH